MSFDQCLICLFCLYSIIQNGLTFIRNCPVYLFDFVTLKPRRALVFTASILLLFQECLTTGIIQYRAFSNCLVLGNMNLTFILSFYGLTVHISLSLSSSSLYSYSTGCLVTFPMEGHLGCI